MGVTTEFYSNISDFLIPVPFAFPGGAFLPEAEKIMSMLGKHFPTEININGTILSAGVFRAVGDFLREQGTLQCIDEGIGREGNGQLHEHCAAADIFAESLDLGISGERLTALTRKASDLEWNPLYRKAHEHNASGVILNWIADPNKDVTWGLSGTTLAEKLSYVGAPLIVSCPTTYLDNYACSRSDLNLSEQDELIRTLSWLSIPIVNKVITSPHNRHHALKTVHIVEVNRPRTPSNLQTAIMEFTSELLTRHMNRNVLYYQVG